MFAIVVVVGVVVVVVVVVVVFVFAVFISFIARSDDRICSMCLSNATRNRRSN